MSTRVAHAESGAAHGVLQAPRLVLEVYERGLPRSAARRLVLGCFGELFDGVTMTAL